MTVEIIHGDSREVVKTLTRPINCIITDPPYGMNFKSNSAELPSGKRYVEEIEGDGDLQDALCLFYEVIYPLTQCLVNDADIYVFTRWQILDPWVSAVRGLGFNVANVLVWDKGTPGMGDVMGTYGNSYEMIIHAKKGRRPVRERRSSIISVPRVDNKSHIHPTEKPVDLLEILVRQSTNPGDFVVDPFSGSGSTIVACKNLDRDALGIETKERYVRDSRERLTQGGLF